MNTETLETIPEVEPELALAKRADPPPAPVQITAAQAKVEAVAHLTMKAYEMASTLKLSQEEIEGLQRDFEDEAFKPGAAGKENLIYIEHAFLRDRLNQVIGPGQWAIVPRNRWAEPFMTKAHPGKPAQEGSRVYVEAMLLIRGAFVAESVGAMEYYPSNAAQNYGDAVEGAKTAAFRRCAKELGVGLQAWKKDWCDGWWKRQRGPKAPQTTQTTITPPPAQQSAPKATPSHAAPQIKVIPEGALSETGILQLVSSKQGSSAKGPWTLWGLRVNESFHNTFSKTIGEAAQKAKGKSVTVLYTQDQRGRTVVDLIVDGLSVDNPPTP